MADMMARKLAELERRARALERKPSIYTKRGWRDDFIGAALDSRYRVQLSGGSITLLDGAAGGWAYFWTPAVANNYARLWLGDQFGNYDTLLGFYGWTMIVHMKISVTGGSWAIDFGAWNSAVTEYVCVGANTTVFANNWCMYGTGGVAGGTSRDSGIAFDTNWHWHRLDVFPLVSGIGASYQLDGTEICSVGEGEGDHLPDAYIAPIIRVRNVDAISRNMSLDYWAIIPRNIDFP